MPNDRWAVLIGVEGYLDREHLRAVPHAEDDVRAIRDALKGQGMADDRVVVLVGEEATRTSIEHHLRTVVEEKLPAGGTLLVYFVGHGIAAGGANYLLGRDTRAADPARTGIALVDLIRLLGKSQAHLVQLYLDCPHEGVTVEDDDAPTMSQAALERSMAGAEGLVCFTSCLFSQVSHVSDRLKHGVWAQQLIRALSGQAPEILDDGRVLTAGRLAAFLAEGVPPALRDAFSGRKVQTPWSRLGDDPDAPIADLGRVAGKAKAKRVPKANAFKDLLIAGEARVGIKGLAGFIKGRHALPKKVDERTESFLGFLAQDDLRADADAMHRTIRTALGYKRKEIEVYPAQEGVASLRTPDFQYTVSVGAAGDDPAVAIFRRELSDIRHPDVLEDPRFAGLFDGKFERAGLTLDRRIDVEALIDRLEDDGLAPDYQPEATEFTLPIAGGVARVTEDRLELSYRAHQPLADLLRGLAEAIKILPKTAEEKSLPPPSGRP